MLAKVGDFGLSQHVAGDLTDIQRTWQWLAPEVTVSTFVLKFVIISQVYDARAVRYTERSDLYSLGVVLWEIVSHG